MSITIYGVAPSTFVKTARMVCTEKGLDHELEGFEFGSDGHQALHPFKKMPAANIDGDMVFETTAIARRLEAMNPTPQLFPAGKAGIRNELWASATADYLYRGMIPQLLGDTEPTVDLGAFDAGLATSEWFAGDAVGYADLLAAPIIGFGVFKKGDALLADHPNLRRWQQAIMARPAVAEILAA